MAQTATHNGRTADNGQLAGQECFSDSGRAPGVEVRAIETARVHEIENIRAVSEELVEAMVEAIREEGQIHTPLRVVRLAEVGFDLRREFGLALSDEEYERSFGVVGGHRRLAAARALGIATVPVACVSARRIRGRADLFLAQAGDNAHRAQATPIDEARFYRELRRCGMTVAQIAECDPHRNSQSTIRKRLELLSLPEAARALVERSELRQEAAQVLLSIGDSAPRVGEELARRLERGQLSGREVEARPGRALRALAADPERPGGCVVVPFNARQGETLDAREVASAVRSALGAGAVADSERESVEEDLAAVGARLGELPAGVDPLLTVSEAERMEAESLGGIVRVGEGRFHEEAFCTEADFLAGWLRRAVSRLEGAGDFETAQQAPAVPEQEQEQRRDEREREAEARARARRANLSFGERLWQRLGAGDGLPDALVRLLCAQLTQAYGPQMALGAALAFERMRVREERMVRGAVETRERLPSRQEAERLLHELLGSAAGAHEALRLCAGALCAAAVCDPGEAPAEWARRLLPLELPVGGEGSAAEGLPEELWCELEPLVGEHLDALRRLDFVPDGAEVVRRDRRAARHR